jgi:hypothetical protein
MLLHIRHERRVHGEAENVPLPRMSSALPRCSKVLKMLKTKYVHIYSIPRQPTGLCRSRIASTWPCFGYARKPPNNGRRYAGRRRWVPDVHTGRPARNSELASGGTAINRRYPNAKHAMRLDDQSDRGRLLFYDVIFTDFSQGFAGHMPGRRGYAPRVPRRACHFPSQPRRVSSRAPGSFLR